MESKQKNRHKIISTLIQQTIVGIIEKHIDI